LRDSFLVCVICIVKTFFSLSVISAVVSRLILSVLHQSAFAKATA
jgi:hypothetical protein